MSLNLVLLTQVWENRLDWNCPCHHKVETYQLRFPVLLDSKSTRSEESCLSFCLVVRDWEIGRFFWNSHSLRIMGKAGISFVNSAVERFSSSAKHELSETNSTRKGGISSEILLSLVSYNVISVIYWCGFTPCVKALQISQNSKTIP